MRPSGPQTRARWAALCWLVLLLLVGGHRRAAAQQLSLQTQFTYTLSETAFADGRSESHGKFSPLYLVLLRGPLIGGTDTQLELGITGYNSGDPQASIDQRNYRLSLFAQGDRLNLLASASRDTNRVTVPTPEGGKTTSLTLADALSLNGVLTYPGYPHLSFQYAKAMARVEDGPKSESTNYTLGVRHDWGPLRLVADQMRQQSAFSATTSESRQYGVSFERSLSPMVRFGIDHYTSLATLGQAGGETETRTRQTTARISALPTPAAVLDAELSYSESRLAGSPSPGGGSGWAHGVYLRSEVLPGVRLDVARKGRDSRSPHGDNSSGQISANLGFQLHRTASVTTHWSRSGATTRSDAGGLQTDDANVGAIALTVSPSPQMDLFAEYRMASQSSQESSYDLTTSGLGVRGYVSPMLSLGASVHQEQRDSLRGGKLDRTLSRFLTLDASWLPSDLWNLSVGVSIARTTDSQQSLSISPHFDARWDVDPATTLTLQYRLLRTDQEDGVLASSTTGALLTGRLIRRLPNEGILEVSYDFNRATSSVFAWERVLELRYSRSY